jgi:hypothetical protein
MFFNTWIIVIKPSKLSTGSFESVAKWWNWPWQRLCLRLIIAFRRQILDFWYLYVYRPNIEYLTQTPFITRYYLNLSKIWKKSIFHLLPLFARFLRTVALNLLCSSHVICRKFHQRTRILRYMIVACHIWHATKTDCNYWQNFEIYWAIMEYFMSVEHCTCSSIYIFIY